MTVIAYHLVWTAYGTWLPNDPRGSGSHSVYTADIAELGEAHLGRKQMQPTRAAVREFYGRAGDKLQFRVIRFDDNQRNIIGESFAENIHEQNYTCYACAIMPDHVHLVIRKHRDSAEHMIGNFQGMSRARLLNAEQVPEGHPVWTKRGWKVFLNTPEEVWGRVRYVEKNPAKEGLAVQRWAFVTPTIIGRCADVRAGALS